MRRSYLDYAMSVIVARALPDVRDGLKPVHRRILYSMQVNGNDWNRGYRKSARIVGDVMGKYHPHGDLAIYDAMVRMAQDFAMRLPLIDGQGNFGSMDGDPPAADALHRGAARPRRRRAARRPRQGHGRFPAQLRRDRARAEGPAGRLPEPAGQRRAGHRGRHGDQHPAAQSRRGHRRLLRLSRQSGDHRRRADGASCRRRISRPAASSSAGPARTPPTRPAAARSSCAPRRHIEEIRKDREAIVVTEMPYQVNKAQLHRAHRRDACATS